MIHLVSDKITFSL